MQDKPDVHTIKYFDNSGQKLLWSEKMNLSKLWGVGDSLINKGVAWTVRRVAVARGVQYVNLVSGWDNIDAS